MIALCLYFKVHQAFQLNEYHLRDIDFLHSYGNTKADLLMVNKLADECYLPANEIILSNIASHKGKFKVSYSISGTVLELLQLYRPDVIESFKEIFATGSADIFAETYYNSLSYLYSKSEFKRQVVKHEALVVELFGIRPLVFRNTELIYNNQLAPFIAAMGLKGILCEGANDILRGRSPNHVYSVPELDTVKLLLRNHVLSDDIAFRFDDNKWNAFPLTAEKFAGWIHNHPEGTDVINLLLDYETFGIHKKRETGIFEFLDALPGQILSSPSVQFSLPAEVLSSADARDIFDAPQIISWKHHADVTNPWAANVMQNNTIKKIYSLEKLVLKSSDEMAIDMWGRLQTSDYFHFMTEEFAKAENYNYSNPFNSAKESFEFYNNIVFDFEISLIKQEIERFKMENIAN